MSKLKSRRRHLRAIAKATASGGPLGYQVEALEKRVLLSSYALSTLVSFNGANGEYPYAGLIFDSAGNIFGTTEAGGANNDGAIFEIAHGSGVITTLASLNGANGQAPDGGVVLDSFGNLFGTTENGGASGYGTVFEIARGTGVITTLASFNGANGEFPTYAGVVLDASGNLFGTTRNGGTNGGADGWGTVFEIAHGSGVITTLASFNNYPNGTNPLAGVILDSSGNLFGTTANGDGTVFELARGGGVITTLATFNGANGANPYGGVVLDSSGNLFGTTRNDSASNDGTVFEVASGTHALSTLVSFNDANGALPQAGLIFDSAGNLYGTTEEGGSSGRGTVFEVASGTHALSTLVSFNDANGAYPDAGLIFDSAGNLYGTTDGGGSSGNGTVFELTPVSPYISSVVLSGSGQNTTFTINGSGFGRSPFSSAFIGDLDDLALNDTRAGSAGFVAGGSHFGSAAPDAVTLNYQSWSNNQIVIGGFGGTYGQNGASIRPGDTISVTVWNSGSTVINGPQASWQGTVPVLPVLAPAPQNPPSVGSLPAEPQLWTAQPTFQATLAADPSVQPFLIDECTPLYSANAVVQGSSPNQWKSFFSGAASATSAVGAAAGFAGDITSGAGVTKDVLEGSLSVLEQTPKYQSNAAAKLIGTGANAAEELDDAASLYVNCGLAGASGGVDVVNDGGCFFSAVGTVSGDILSPAFSYLANDDPPDPNYTEVFVPEPVLTAPVSAPSSFTPEMAALMLQSTTALDQTMLYLNAVEVTLNRYSSALAAGDASSASMQYLAFLQYLGIYNMDAAAASADLAKFASGLEAAGIGTRMPTADDLSQIEGALQSQGASVPGLEADLEAQGFSDSEIGEMVQEAIASPPALPAESADQALEALSSELGSASVPVPLSSFETLSDGVLTVDGTSGNDTISFTSDGTNLTGTLNGVSATPIALSYVTGVDVVGGAGNDAITLDFSNGNPLPAGGISLTGGSGLNTLKIIGGSGSDNATVAINGGAFILPANTPGGGTLNYALGTVSIAAGASLALAYSDSQADQTVFAVNNLFVAGTLDITNNTLVATETNVPVSQVATWVQNAGVGASIISSLVTGPNSQASRAVGYGDFDEDPLTVPAGDVEVKYVPVGDTDLDGYVDITDVGRAINNLGQSPGYYGGDILNQGMVNITDIAALINDLGGNLSGAGDGAGAAAVAVRSSAHAAVSPPPAGNSLGSLFSDTRIAGDWLESQGSVLGG